MPSVTYPTGLMGAAPMPVGASIAASRQLLVPTDFSPAAEQAIRVAAGLARRIWSAVMAACSQAVLLVPA